MADANRPLAGILWMALTGLSFVAMTAVVKHVGAELPSAQAAFLRFLFGLVFFIPLVHQMRAVRLSRRQLRLFVLRGAFHTAGVLLWFYAMTQISIAEVTAMNYLTPIYVTIGAALFLGERLAWRRILAIAVALAGAMLILRPGFRELSPGHYAMILTAFALGGSYLITKLMSGEVSAEIIVGMLSITVTIALAPVAYAVWVPPSWDQLGWLFVVAFLATAGHYAMTRAYAAAPVAVTQPVTFLALVWAVILGWAVFGEAVDIWVILGGVLILAAVCFIAWRESRLRRAPTRPTGPGDAPL